MKTTCAECGKTWGGARSSHCTVCHESFSSDAAGDKHRRGEYPDGRYCTTEGLEFSERRGVWKSPGTWIPGVGVEQERPITPEAASVLTGAILSPQITKEGS